MSGSVVLVEVVRSGFVEGRHHGSAVVLAPDGSVAYAAGDVHAPVLPRSCNKPLQGVAMVRAGLDLSPDLLAMAVASHSGEGFHVEAVRRILVGAGLTEAHLQNPPDWPLVDEVKEQVIRAGGERSRLLMNCSGKHAGMLATCVANGWDTASYLDPGHPLQQTILTTFAELTDEPVDTVSVDGCGAPLLSASLVGLAHGFARLATATDGPERTVSDAIRAFPENVSGTTRDECALLRAMPGSIAKAGAESCYVVARPDGWVAALKHDDGSTRPRRVTMSALLDRAGLLDGSGIDAEAVRALGRMELLGGSAVVGEVRAVLPPSV